MALESATFISQLVQGNPSGTDQYSSADDHLRLIKAVLRSTFPNLSAAVNPTPTELNHLVGVTSAIQTQLAARELAANKNVANGYAGLDAGALLLAARFPALTGNITTPGGSLTTTIANDVVTNAMLANMVQATLKGRASGAGTGDPVDLTAAQLVTILLAADGAGSLLDADLLDGQEGTFYQNASNLNAGTVGTARLGSGTADATTFLRGDQTWATTELTIVKGANEARSSTVTPADDAVLLASVLANTRYGIEGVALVSCATGTPGFRARLGNVSLSLSTLTFNGFQAGGFGAGSAHEGATDASMSIQGSGVHVLQFGGSILVGGSAGTLAFQWAQGASDAAATTLRAGSWMKVKRL